MNIIHTTLWTHSEVLYFFKAGCNLVANAWYMQLWVDTNSLYTTIILRINLYFIAFYSVLEFFFNSKTNVGGIAKHSNNEYHDSSVHTIYVYTWVQRVLSTNTSILKARKLLVNIIIYNCSYISKIIVFFPMRWSIPKVWNRI